MINDNSRLSVYHGEMIGSFRHKGLKLLFEHANRSKVKASDVGKIERILARLNEAEDARDMALPGYKLHPLKGDLAGFWSVWVSGNWRIIFRFEGVNARDVNLIDYH
jgi:proteic killer suppression protein